VWHEGDSAPEGTYRVKVNNVWYNIEYINDEWYYTYWTDSKGRYLVNRDDLIKQAHYFGLGTKNLPYATREDQPQESPEEESPQTTKRSEEDEPLTTQEQQTEVGRLAYQFHETNLEQSPLEDTAKIHGYRAVHQIYQDMATAATTITEQQQQPIQWMYQAAPPPQQTPPQQLTPQQPPQQPAGGPPGGAGGPPGGGGPPPGGGPQQILPVPPQQPQQQQPRGSNGGLQGKEPELYTGDRKKTRDWYHQWNIYMYSNLDKESMRSPLSRIALALGYFRGEKVMEWARQQLDLANQ